MKRPSKEEMMQTIDAFGIQTESDLVTLDRSTIEMWARCPWQAAAIESGRCLNVSDAMLSGIEGHEALSRTALLWIASNGAYSPSELCEELKRELRATRPDVQPDAISGVIKSAWDWARFIHGIHPGNIMALDGGDELDPPRSGQLAADFDDLSVRVTSEIDLLYSGESPELLHEVDYKTGWTPFDADTVAKSFQFQCHAMLAFTNYPDVNGLEVTVWDMRRNQRSYRVVFDREREHQYRARIRMACQTYLEHRDNPPVWPSVEKCGGCPAAAICPLGEAVQATCAADPQRFVAHMAALSAMVENMKDQASKYVDATGKDIVADGIAFGRSKPASSRKAAATLYEVE